MPIRGHGRRCPAPAAGGLSSPLLQDVAVVGVVVVVAGEDAVRRGLGAATAARAVLVCLVSIPVALVLDLDPLDFVDDLGEGVSRSDLQSAWSLG